MNDRIRKQLCVSLKAKLEGKARRAPEAGGAMLEAFAALNRARSWQNGIPNPISWESLAAWSKVMRVPIRPDHAETIMALDEVWLEHFAKINSNAPEGAKTLPPVSEHALTAGLFDAVFG